MLQSITSLNPDIADGARHEMILDYFRHVNHRGAGAQLDFSSLLPALSHVDKRVVSLAIRIFGLFPSNLPSAALPLIFQSNLAFAVLEFVADSQNILDLDDKIVSHYLKLGIDSPNVTDFHAVLKLVPCRKWKIDPNWILDPERKVQFYTVRAEYAPLDDVEWYEVLKYCFMGDRGGIANAKCVDLLCTKIPASINPTVVENVIRNHFDLKHMIAGIQVLAVYVKVRKCVGDVQIAVRFCVALLTHFQNNSIINEPELTIFDAVLNYVVKCGDLNASYIAGIQKSLFKLLDTLKLEIYKAENMVDSILELIQLCPNLYSYKQTLEIFQHLPFKFDFKTITRLMESPLSNKKMILSFVPTEGLISIIDYILHNQNDWSTLHDLSLYLITAIVEEKLDSDIIAELRPRLMPLSVNPNPIVRSSFYNLAKELVVHFGKYRDFQDLLGNQLLNERNSEVVASMLDFYGVLEIHSLISPQDLCLFATFEDYNVKVSLVTKLLKIYSTSPAEFIDAPYLDVIKVLHEDFCWMVRRSCLDLIKELKLSHHLVPAWVSDLDVEAECLKCDPDLLNDEFTFSASILQEFEALGLGNNTLQCYDC